MANQAGVRRTVFGAVRVRSKVHEDRKVKDGFPEQQEEIFAAKYHCVELMFYFLIILRGKREDVKWRGCPKG